MSTDPKKLVKTILFTYLLAAVMLISGYTCKDVPVLIITFSCISIVLFICACLALHENYKKYKIPMYRFLEIIGIIAIIFSIGMMILSLI